MLVTVPVRLRHRALARVNRNYVSDFSIFKGTQETLRLLGLIEPTNEFHRRLYSKCSKIVICQVSAVMVSLPFDGFVDLLFLPYDLWRRYA